MLFRSHHSRYSVMLYAGTTKVSVFFSCIFFLGSGSCRAVRLADRSGQKHNETNVAPCAVPGRGFAHKRHPEIRNLHLKFPLGSFRVTACQFSPIVDCFCDSCGLCGFCDSFVSSDSSDSSDSSAACDLPTACDQIGRASCRERVSSPV